MQGATYNMHGARCNVQGTKYKVQGAWLKVQNVKCQLATGWKIKTRNQKPEV
jgi:hypothetical protein